MMDFLRRFPKLVTGAVLTVVLTASAVPFAVAGSASSGEIAVEGPAAAMAVLRLTRDADVTLRIAYDFVGHDRETAVFLMGWNDVGDRFFMDSYTSQSEFGEAHVQVGGVSGGVVPPVGPSAGRSGYLARLGAGTWHLVYLGNASQPVTRTVFSLETTDPDARWSWTTTRDTQFLTVRNLPSDAKAYVRHIPGGVAVAQGGDHALSVGQRLFGFSRYLPGDVDDHRFELTTPAGDVLPAGDLQFDGWPPGEYRWSFQQVSAGKWPGRLMLLTADLPAPEP